MASKDRSDTFAFLATFGITLALVAALVYFIKVLWPLLPPALALAGFILLAVAAIGYPIYALGQLSNRYLARLKKTQHED
jgi:hypothetical protein